MENKQIQIAGSMFTKFDAVRNPDFDGSLSIQTNISIKSVEKFKAPDTKAEMVKLKYAFIVDYADLGKITVEGIMFLKADSKTQKEILKSWENKSLDSENYMAITNLVLKKASIRALSIEEELGLPFHIRLPSLKAKKE